MKHSFFRLLRYEWRKNFRSPWLIAFLVLLLAANGWRLQSEFRGQRGTDEALYEQFYTQWKGTITTENVGELMTIYAPLMEKEKAMSLNRTPGSGTYTSTEAGDQHFFSSCFYTEMQYDYLYINQATLIAQRADALAGLYDDQGLSYPGAESRALAGLFRGRVIPDFADTRYLRVWLEHDYSSLLVLLMCLFALSTVFVSEWESQMYMLQRVSPLGSGASVAAKLISSALFVCGVCVLFYGEDFLVLQLLSGHWEAPSSPVYAIRYLESTPLTMTVGSFVVWTVAVKTLGVLTLAWLILLLSCLARQTLTAFASGLGSILALVLLQEYSRSRVGLKWFNPLELIHIRELVLDVRFVNILGRPVILHSFVILGSLFIMALLTLGIARTHPGRAKRRWGK